MATTIATLATLNTKTFTLTSPPNHASPPKPATIKPNSLLLSNTPKGLVAAAAKIPSPLSSAAIAGAFFSALIHSDAAFAAQQIADLAAAEAAGSDSRGIALLLPIIPALGWVLFNILQPALNQLNKMRNEKGVVAGLGVGAGMAAAGWLWAAEAEAAEMMMVADASSSAASSDSRGTLLLFVVAPAILWVLYNILQPALNQLNKMRSG